jgi:hypothetical protein
VPEAQIVAAGFNHTLDKALMLNFVEMNLSKAAYPAGLLNLRRSCKFV